MKNHCIFPGCKKPRHSRGLCLSHYGMLARLIREHKMTWEEAEKNGKCLPKVKSTAFRDWVGVSK